jgi:hypothetical protein
MTEITLSIEDGDRINIYHPSFQKRLKKLTDETDSAIEDTFNLTADGLIDEFLGMLQDIGIYFD